MHWLLIASVVSGVLSTSLVENSSASGAAEAGAEEITTLAGILLRLERAVSDCTGMEDSLYRTFIEKIPREAPTKSPSKVSLRMRRRLPASTDVVSESVEVDADSIDREGFVRDFINTMAKTEADRKSLMRFMDHKSHQETKPSGVVARGLEMMRACVAYHGYCVKAIESAQALINSSSRCRDLSKTKKREFGEQLSVLSEDIRERLALIASQRDVMGDLVRKLIAKTNVVVPSGAEGTTETSTASPDSSEIVATDAAHFLEGSETLESADDALESLLSEWHDVVPDLVPTPVYDVEVDSDSENDEYLNVRFVTTSTVEPMTSSV
jgi:hypothetical protein